MAKDTSGCLHPGDERIDLHAQAFGLLRQRGRCGGPSRGRTLIDAEDRLGHRFGSLCRLLHNPGDLVGGSPLLLDRDDGGKGVADLTDLRRDTLDRLRGPCPARRALPARIAASPGRCRTPRTEPGHRLRRRRHADACQLGTQWGFVAFPAEQMQAYIGRDRNIAGRIHPVFSGRIRK